MPLSSDYFDPEGKNANEVGIRRLVDDLTRKLGNQGYSFAVAPNSMPGGFFRIFVSKGMSAGWGGESDLYLDLRMGLGSVSGQTIEMASSKPGTFAMPGFARHIAGSNKIDAPIDVFSDYIKSIYSVSSESGKTPQQVAWSVYQTGTPQYQYPGAREWGAEEHETALYPAAGGVLGPSALSGKRQFMASTVRYFVQGDEEARRGYVMDMLKRLKGGAFPQLAGLGPELRKWKSWVPITTGTYTETEMGTEELYGFQPRGITGTLKSLSTVFGARETADVPFMRDPNTGRLERITPTKPTKAGGIRSGWTLSSVVMPGETQPNIVFSKQMALVDQPDQPGAVFASAGAWRSGASGQGETVAIGEEGYEEYVFGTRTIDELKKLVQKGLRFNDLTGQQISPGQGMQKIGEYPDEANLAKLSKKQRAKYEKLSRETGEPVYPTTPLLIEKKGYSIVPGMMTLHVPEYYDPSESGEFSNFPVRNEEGKLMTTERFVKALQDKYAGVLNVVQYSSKGGKMHVGGEKTDNPAEVYLTVPTARLLPVGMKPEGVKGFVEQLNQQMKLRLLGQTEDTPVDFLTQEAKIPTRVLMSSFGVMNMQTQLDFVDTLIAKNPNSNSSAISAVKEFIEDAYAGKGLPKGQTYGVSINLEKMARIWERETGTHTSPDLLFADVFKQIFKTPEAEAGALRQRFGIGIPIDQMAGGTIYTQQTMDEFKRVLSGVEKKFGKDFSKDIEFVPYKPPIARLLEATEVFGEDVMDVPLYQMRYRVQQGQAIQMQVGTVYTPEYSSQSGYLGPKAIESVMRNFPRTAISMGLTAEGDPNRWLGPLTRKAYGKKGEPPPSVKGWNELFFWRPFQRALMMGEEDIIVPADTVELNPDLASAVSEAINLAEMEKTDRAKLVTLKKLMENIPLNMPIYGKYTAGTNLAESFIYDINTSTLVPKVSSILDIEHYGIGAEEGMTETYMGDNYIRLLKSVAESAASNPGSMVNTVGTARNQFFKRVTSAFNPEGKRSKEIMRNVVGITLPGSRGGRYQGLSQLELGEGYASDEWLRTALSNGGFMDGKEITSVMKWLNSGVDAYLPVLFQRFPDVSGINTMVPIRVHSAKHLKAKGIDVPEGGPAASDLFFLGSGGNRVSVGDQDGDPYKVNVLRMIRKGTHAWELPNDVLNEFNDRSNALFSTKGGIDTSLQYMFGNIGTSSSKGSLDVQRKNLVDYLNGILNRSSSLTERYTKEPQPSPVSDIMEAAASVTSYYAGMASSYYTRWTAKLGETASGRGGEGQINLSNPSISARAYERGGLSYQMYLDRMLAVKNGLTQLETVMNTFGIYGVTGEPGNLSYRIGYKLTDQGPGNEIAIPSEELRGTWPKAGGPGLTKTNYLLNQLVGSLARQPQKSEDLTMYNPELMSNEMLAMGFSVPGKEGEVLSALNDPKAFYRSLNYSEASIKSLSPEVLNDRGLIIKQMIKTGQAGFDSPYYLMFAYKAINRFTNKFPEFAHDPSVQMPWLDGKMTPIRDIVNTKPYRMARILSALTMSPTDKLDPVDFEELQQLGANRLEAMSGVYASYKSTTGGISKETKFAEEEYIQRHISAIKLFEAEKIKMIPEIHASELGTLGPPTKKLAEQGWSPPYQSAKMETVYKAILRSAGLEMLMGDEETEGAKLVKVDWSRFPEAIVGGRTYESKYKDAHPELSGVGKVDTGKNLQFRVSNTMIHGTPDFLGYDENSGNLVIVDTKQPAGWAKAATQSPEENPMTAEQAVAHTKQYRYRMQLLSYAWGLEQKARESTPSEWETFMGGWGIKDKQRIGDMYNAALRGSFQLSLAPGRWTTAKGLEELPQINVPYTDEERAEYVDYIKNVESNYFTPKYFGARAAHLYSVLSSSRRIPEGLRFYKRMEGAVEPEYIEILKRVGEQTGALPRMAGGGWLSNRISLSGEFIGNTVRALGELGVTQELAERLGLKVTIKTPQSYFEMMKRKGYTSDEAYEHTKGVLGEFAQGPNYPIDIPGTPKDELRIIGMGTERYAQHASPEGRYGFVKETVAHELGHFVFARNPEFEHDIRALVGQQDWGLSPHYRPKGTSQFQLRPPRMAKVYPQWWKDLYATEVAASYWEAAARITEAPYKQILNEAYGRSTRWGLANDDRSSLGHLYESAWEENAYVNTARRPNLRRKYLPVVTGFENWEAGGETPGTRISGMLNKMIEKGEWLTQWSPKELMRKERFESQWEDRSSSIHVGEGGPEDIEITKSGISIVPSSHLPEARAARGEGRGMTGSTDLRSSRGILSRIRVGEGGPIDLPIGAMVKRAAGGLGEPTGSNATPSPSARSEQFYDDPVAQWGEESLAVGNTTTQQAQAQVEAVAQANAEVIPAEFWTQIERMALSQENIATFLEDATGAMQAIAKSKGKIVFQGASKTPNPMGDEIKLRKEFDIMAVGVKTVEKYEADVRKVLGAEIEKAGKGDLLTHIQGVPSAKDYLAIAERELPRQQWMSALSGAGLMGKRATQVKEYGRSFGQVIGMVGKAGGWESLAQSAAVTDPLLAQEILDLRDYVMGTEKEETYTPTPTEEEQKQYDATNVARATKIATTKKNISILEGEIKPVAKELFAPEGKGKWDSRWTEIEAKQNRRVELQKELHALEAEPTAGPQPTTRTVATPSRAEEMVQGVATAEALRAFRNEPETNFSKYLGASIDSLKKFDSAINDLTKSSDKLQEAQKKGLGIEMEYEDFIKKKRLAEARETKIEAESKEAISKQKAPELYEGGRFVGAEKAKKLLELGAVTPEQADLAFTSDKLRRQAEKEEGQAQEAIADTDKGGSRVGMLARKLFGGFGLMYMRSIGGLMATGAYTGYAERMGMEQQMAQPFLAAGGQQAITPMEEQQRILATQYGGSGGLAMQSARNIIMKEQQPLYQAATSTLAGISAGGMVAWLTGEQGLGWSKQKSNTAALLAGVGIMGANEALSIYGATQDVQGTSMNLAIRQARGENLGRTAGISMATSAATYGLTGGLMGGLPGAAIGIGLGALVGFGSNYQQIAASLNPDIKKETELLEALSSRKQGQTITNIISQYGKAESQAPYYARLAAEVASVQKQNLGISTEALATAGAYEVRRGTTLGEAGFTQFAQLTQGGFNPEAYGVMMSQLQGMSIFQANAPGGGATGYSQLFGRNVIEQPTESAIARNTAAIMQWAQSKGAGVAGEQMQAVAGGIGAMGIYGVAELQKRQSPELWNPKGAPPSFVMENARRAMQDRMAATPFVPQGMLSVGEAKFQAGLDFSNPATQFLYGKIDVSSGGISFAQATGPMPMPGARSEDAQLKTEYLRRQESQYFEDVRKGNTFENWKLEQGIKYGEQLSNIQATGWFEAYSSQVQLQAKRKALGLETTAAPDLAEYETRATNIEAQLKEMQQIQEQAVVPGMISQLQTQTVSMFGFRPQYAPNITGLEAQQQLAQTQFGEQIAGQFMMGGMNAQTAATYGGAFTQMNPVQFRQYRGLFSGNPLQTAASMLDMPQTALAMTQGGMLPGMGGSQLNPLYMGMVDIGARGLTGMPWGTSSLALPAEVASLMAQGQMMPGSQQGPAGMGGQMLAITPMNMAQAVATSSYNTSNRIWGQGWQQKYSTTGNELINALIGGGQQEAQALMQYQQAQQSATQAGIGLAQVQLQGRYQPQFWALEDRGRQLGYAQTEWGFQMQGQQLALGRENFAATTGFQQQQMGMQRGWQQQDWAYQAQTRGMQWGWRQEDFQEQVRFMTGRDRRLAERQMGRETIMYGMEGEQIDKQKSRQKELWQLEDERFAQQVGYQNSLFDLQEENLNKQKEFYEQRKALESEQVALNRKYWEEQHALQLKAAESAAGYAAINAENAKIMLEFSQWSQDATSENALFNEETIAKLATSLDKMGTNFTTFVNDVERLQEALGKEGDGGDGGGGGGDTHTCPVCGQKYTGSYEDHVKNYKGSKPHPMQHGGRVNPGETYLVGENGPEPFIPDVAGRIMARDPWSATIVSTSSDGNTGQPQIIHLIVNLGNDRLIDRMLDAVDAEIQQ